MSKGFVPVPAGMLIISSELSASLEIRLGTPCALSTPGKDLFSLGRLQNRLIVFCPMIVPGGCVTPVKNESEKLSKHKH
jgi:hypothetical protein